MLPELAGTVRFVTLAVAGQWECGLISQKLYPMSSFFIIFWRLQNQWLDVRPDEPYATRLCSQNHSWDPEVEEPGAHGKWRQKKMQE